MIYSFCYLKLHKNFQCFKDFCPGKKISLIFIVIESVTFTEVKSQLQFQALQNAFCLGKRKRKHECFPKGLTFTHFTLCSRLYKVIIQCRNRPRFDMVDHLRAYILLYYPPFQARGR